MFDLSGKSALVTGASGGIGGAIARYSSHLGPRTLDWLRPTAAERDARRHARAVRFGLLEPLLPEVYRTIAGDRAPYFWDMLAVLDRTVNAGRKISDAVLLAVSIYLDIYNLFNSNVTTAYQQTYEYRTNGAAWLTPTAIAAPRLARFHVTVAF